MPEIHFLTDQIQEVIDITAEVAKEAADFQDGLCSLFLQNTTAALAILTSEEGLATDYITAVKTLVPALEYVGTTRGSCEGACSEFARWAERFGFPSREADCSFSQYQRIVLVEFEGPKTAVGVNHCRR